MKKKLLLSTIILFIHTSILSAQSAVPANTNAEDADPHGVTAMRSENLSDEQARSHFRIGQALYEEGRYVDAAREFELAYSLSHRPVLLFNVYLASRDAGNIERAIQALDQYLREEPNPQDADVLRRRLRAMSETYAADQAERARLEQERIRLAQEQASLAEEAAYQRQRAAQAEQIVAQSRSPVPWIVGGTGLAILAGAGVTAIIANGRMSDLDTQCPDGFCSPSINLNEAKAEVRRPAIATDVMLGVGAATVVTGIVMLVTRSNNRDETPQVTATASCDRNGCIAIMGRSF